MVGFKYNNNYETWIVIWGRSGSTCLFWNDFVPDSIINFQLILKRSFTTLNGYATINKVWLKSEIGKTHKHQFHITETVFLSL